MSLSVPTPLSTNELLVCSVSGALTFPAILGLGQLVVFKPLRLTCSSPLASVCGGASVLVAGCLASVAAVQTASLLHHWKPSELSQSPVHHTTIGPPEILASTVASAFVFRALGGRFSSVLPSHLLKPGAFAREWIPARSSLASERERHIIQQLGRSHGCHSCGKRSVKQFNADHQPPNKINNSENVSSGSNGVLQRLYPQCKNCSGLQGSLISRNSKAQAVRAHPLSLRAYHLFLPIPFAVAYLKSGVVQPGVEPLRETAAPVVEVKEQGTQVVQEERDTQQPESVWRKGATAPLRSIFGDSDLSSLIRNFPLLIIWNRVVCFLDSFPNAGDAFHITLWAFAIIAALGAA